MSRRACVLVLLLSSACQPTRRDATTAPTAGTLEPGERALEDFLRVSTDVEAAHPLRATIVRAGGLRVEHDGDPVNEPSNRNVRVSAIVVDEDVASSPRRPRLLCIESTHRIAVHMEVDDLATVARTDATLVATPPVRDELGDEPGIRLAPGAALVPAGHGDPDILWMRHEGKFVRATGLVAATKVGIAFRPGELPGDADGPPNASIAQPTKLFATPGGVELASLDPRGMGPLLVRRLGPAIGTRVLVRYEEPDVHVVGWVEKALLTDGAFSRLHSTTTIGKGRGPEGATVQVPKGTLLLGSALRRPVGVVVEDAAMACVEDCDGAQPKLLVSACTDAIEVWARRP
jgi:hypothetical protein